MLDCYEIQTGKEGFINITGEVEKSLLKSGVKNGICVVYCPHTTAAITINENADPDVVHDVLIGLAGAFPDRRDFRHAEGNSTAHLKSNCVGASETIPVEDGHLILGTWQGIFFCEFDGPRTRYFYVKIIEG